MAEIPIVTHNAEFRSMKNWIILIVVMCSLTVAASAQSAKDSLPYLKYPTLPAFNLLMRDSSTIFNTYNIKEGKPTVLFFFSPDCEHCHMTTKALVEKMGEMKNANFYFFTFMSLELLKPFAEMYHLDMFKNITVGKDYQYFFPDFYGAKFVPYLVVYDKHKKLVKLYENAVKMDELVPLVRSLK
jgi:thiol-disulfide isomerase/thioredoxin